MVSTEVEITVEEIPFSETQVNSTVQGRLGSFRGIDIFHNSEKPDADPDVRKSQLYDFIVASTDTANATATIEILSTPAIVRRASGKVTCTAVVVGNTVTIGTSTFTAASLEDIGSLEFEADVNDDEQTARNLASLIDKAQKRGISDNSYDARSFVIDVDLTARTFNAAVGNSIVLTSNSSNLAVTGSGTLTGGVDADFVTVNGLVYTAVAGDKKNNTEFSADGTLANIAADLADSITQDTRDGGTIGKVNATSTGAVVNMVQHTGGTEGNATTLATSNNLVLEISGALFTGGTGSGPVTVNVASRSVEISEKIGENPIQFVGFFTGLLNDPTATFRAIPKVSTERTIEYDIIYTAVGTGAVTADLFIVSVEAPEGINEPIFPVLPNSIDPIQIDVVQRTSTGNVRVYDYFMLST